MTALTCPKCRGTCLPEVLTSAQGRQGTVRLKVKNLPAMRCDYCGAVTPRNGEFVPDVVRMLEARIAAPAPQMRGLFSKHPSCTECHLKLKADNTGSQTVSETLELMETPFQATLLIATLLCGNCGREHRAAFGENLQYEIAASLEQAFQNPLPDTAH